MDKLKSIELLLAGRISEITETTVIAYSIAVAKFEDHIVEKAVIRFLQDEVSDHNLGYPVIPDELARECKKLSGEMGNSIEASMKRFREIWNKPDATQAALEAPDTVRDRQIAADREKTPDERLNAINRIRKKCGQEPFNPYAKVKSHGTPTKGGIRDYSKAQIGDTSRLAATLETKVLNDG
jgi:hypothetical protein